MQFFRNKNRFICVEPQCARVVIEKSAILSCNVMFNFIRILSLLACYREITVLIMITCYREQIVIISTVTESLSWLPYLLLPRAYCDHHICCYQELVLITISAVTESLSWSPSHLLSRDPPQAPRDPNSYIKSMLLCKQAAVIAHRIPVARDGIFGFIADFIEH